MPGKIINALVSIMGFNHRNREGGETDRVKQASEKKLWRIIQPSQQVTEAAKAVLQLTRISSYNVAKFGVDENSRVIESKLLKSVFLGIKRNDLKSDLPAVRVLLSVVGSSFYSKDALNEVNRLLDKGVKLNGAFSSDITQIAIYYLYILLYLHGRGVKVKHCINVDWSNKFLVANWGWSVNPHKLTARSFFYQSDYFKQSIKELFCNKEGASALCQLETAMINYHKDNGSTVRDKSADQQLLGILWGLHLLDSGESESRISKHLMGFVGQKVVGQWDKVFQERI